MRINLGGIFSLFSLFKKKKQEQTNINWVELGSDDVLNCCEQIGVFEELKIEDEKTINFICSSVVEIFNSTEKSAETLKAALIQGFRNNGLNVSEKKATLFVSAYIDSYM